MRNLSVLLGILVLSLGNGFGQSGVSSSQPASGLPPLRTVEENGLTKFDLDFPGGTPGELLAAVQKAMGRPVNAIVPDDYAFLKLPALKMKNVTVAQLFEALGIASRKSVRLAGSPSSSSTSSYGFVTQGRATDDSVWAFFANEPVIPTPSSVCRFYSLAPFLEAGFKVDDITTAVETGWKMLGDASPANIRFHKDTKLLIAVGDASKLEIIDSVLRTLDRPKTKPASHSEEPVQKSPEKP